MIARRAEEIAPFIVMEVLEKAQEMERHGIDVYLWRLASRISTSRQGTKMKTFFVKDSDLRIETMPIIALCGM